MDINEIITGLRKSVKTIIRLHGEGKDEDAIVTALIAEIISTGVMEALKKPAEPVKLAPGFIAHDRSASFPLGVNAGDVVEYQTTERTAGAYAGNINWQDVIGWRRSVHIGFVRHDLSIAAPAALNDGDWIIYSTLSGDTQVSTSGQINWNTVDQWKLASASERDSYFITTYYMHTRLESYPKTPIVVQNNTTVAAVYRDGSHVVTSAQCIDWADVLYWKQA